MMQQPDRRNDGPPGFPRGNENQQNNTNTPANRGPWWRRNLPWLLLLLVIPWVIFLIWNPNSSNSGEQVSYSQFISQVQAGNVASVTITDNSASGTFKKAVQSDVSSGQPNTKFTTTIPNLPSDQTMKILQDNKVKTVGGSSNGSNFLFGLLFQYGPVLLLIIGILWLSRRATAAQGNIFSFGQSRARMYMGGKTKTTFADVAGVDESKVDLEEVVDFLKNPQRYSRLGGKLPKGILLVGPPGTGKTLLAKAVAGEADVPFFSMSGSEFVEMLVGVGASRVRDLFDRAKKASPCIIFIDELDAVGRQRGAGLGGGNDEREQTLNQILVEMDGFDPRQATIVIAATNRPDVLDPALMRPGRFDRQVVVDRPDRNGRQAIFGVHTRGMPLGPDINLDVLARATPGMVGADIANICNEAALLAARRNKDLIDMRDFEDAIDRIMMGAQRPLLLPPEERRVIAYHEGGHALVALLTPGSDSVHKVTIVPRGQALGVTQIMPLDDRHNYPRSYLLGRIAVGLGGRVAEQIAIGEITTGAENDLQNVTNLAREMVTRWGMSSRIGTVFFGRDREVFLGREMSLGQQRDYSEETAAAIDEEVQRIIGERYSYVEKLLGMYRPLLDEIAKRLLEKEVLDEPELRAIVGNVPPADVVRLLEESEALSSDGAASATTSVGGATTMQPA
ncbi:MAG: Cell division-associated, ATP-dependent zinc metalloprotease FtsH [Ktedonobacterales bacterium]|jgi:cell division protease FtsH|nr:MAG: Cell division-associated, ATP-dependent zinc metalloprotease FtsH [Ktedonobacterales bacterium]